MKPINALCDDMQMFLLWKCWWYTQELVHFKLLNLKPEINLQYTWKFSSDPTQNSQHKEELRSYFVALGATHSVTLCQILENLSLLLFIF